MESGPKISIPNNDIALYGYKEFIHASQNDFITPTPNQVTDTILYNYEFSDLFNTVRGLSTFNITTNNVDISGTQVNASGTGETLGTIYSIIVEHWYGDYFWAQSGTINTYHVNVGLNGLTTGLTGAKIRIDNPYGTHPTELLNSVVMVASLKYPKRRLS